MKLAAMVWGTACSVLVLGGAPALAGESTDWKFTATQHRTTQETDALDLNLRGSRGDSVFWVGHYRRAAEFQQSRAGLEHWLAADWGRLLLSGQLATRGFVGLATQAEIGKSELRGLVGIGRTNLRPYYNLNFDPNDALTLGIALALPGGWRGSVYSVHDDRLATGQTVHHATLRSADDPANRLSLDMFQRRGPLGDGGERVRRTGFGLTYDRSPWFVRVVLDPNVNFSGRDMLRISAGARF